MHYLESYVIVMLLVGVIFGIICGRIAQRKGYAYWSYFALGFLLSVIGLVVVLVMQDKSGGPPDGSGGTSGADELLKYKQLLDAGAISEEDYRRAKDRILNTVNHSQIDYESAKTGGKAHSGDKYTPKRLLIASIAINSVITVILILNGGIDLLFSLPLSEEFAPLIPALFQASALSAISGSLLYISLERRSEGLAIGGSILVVLSVAIALVGVFGVISVCIECIRQNVPPIEYYGLGFTFINILIIGGVVLLAITYFKVVNKNTESNSISHIFKQFIVLAKQFLLTARGKSLAIAITAIAVAAVAIFGWGLPQTELNARAMESNKVVQELLTYLGENSSKESDQIESEDSIPLMSRTGEVSYIEDWPSDKIVQVEWKSACYEDEIPGDFLRELNALFGSSAEVLEGNDAWDIESYVWRDVEGAKAAVLYLNTLYDELKVTWYDNELDLEKWIHINCN